MMLKHAICIAIPCTKGVYLFGYLLHIIIFSYIALVPYTKLKQHKIKVLAVYFEKGRVVSLNCWILLFIPVTCNACKKEMREI